MVLQVFGLEICVPDLIWTIIDFFILFALLRIVLFKPILAYMEKRQTRIREGICAGEEAEAKARQEEEKSCLELSFCNSQAIKIISEARKSAKAAREEAQLEAKKQAALIRSQMNEKLTKERDSAVLLCTDHMQEYTELLTKRLLGAGSAEVSGHALAADRKEQEGRESLQWN